MPALFSIQIVPNLTEGDNFIPFSTFTKLTWSSDFIPKSYLVVYLCFSFKRNQFWFGLTCFDLLFRVWIIIIICDILLLCLIIWVYLAILFTFDAVFHNTFIFQNVNHSSLVLTVISRLAVLIGLAGGIIQVFKIGAKFCVSVLSQIYLWILKILIHQYDYWFGQFLYLLFGS